jgi:hypothetical protein
MECSSGLLAGKNATSDKGIEQRSNGVSAGNGHSGGICPDIDGLHDFLLLDDEYVQSYIIAFAPTPAAVGFEASRLDDRRRREIRLSRAKHRTACLEAVPPIRENAMSRNLFASALAALVLLWNAGLANAQQSGTAAEARAMLDRAAAALKTQFKSTALSEFNDKNNKQYHDRDLYVFCLNMSDGKITATANQTLIGTDVRTLKFKDDPFGQRIYDATKGTPEESVATVDYNFPKPGTTEYVSKQSFVTRVGDQGCGVGYYK